MVYPRENGLLTLSKFIAVCALASSFQHVAAQDAVSTPAVVCTAADGDIAVGVQAIPDASCAAGGLGCYSTTCRFCKYSETAKSAHLMTCSSFGYNFPTLAPEPTTAPVAASAGDCSISDGDQAVGIRAITDASCVIGGLGCYSDHCRYCKVEVTPQSAHLANCSSFSAATPTPVAAEPTTPASVAPVVDTTAPAVVDAVAPVAADTVAPVVATLAPIADTLAPGTVVPFTETPTETSATPSTEEPGFGQADYVGTECTIDESFKDLGIDVVADATVTTLDSDYYTDGCRFCKTVDTVEYESFSFCALFPAYYTTPTADTVSPEVNTTAPVVVFDTAAPVVDTAAPVVVAPVVDTAAPVVVAPVVDTTAPAVITDTAAPVVVVDTLAPVVDTIAPVVDTPATDAPVTAADICTTPVSEGDAAVGIQIITDASCASGGLGCIDTICRFCRVATTPESVHLSSCTDLLNPTPSAPATECTTPVSEGDAAAGIQVITDATCVVGGLGCFTEVCRYCKAVNTTQSAHLDDCTKYTNPTSAPIVTDPVFTPVDVVAVECSIDDSFKSLGVDVAVDPTVTAADVDFYMDSCRFCKTFDTAESSTFVACATIAGYSGTAGSIATAGSVAATCDMVVNPGDSDIGLTIVTDVSCVTAGGLGCIGETACKFCKQFETNQSAVYAYCDGYPLPSAASTSGSIAAVVEAPVVSAVEVAIACAGNELSAGDAEGGVAYTYDPIHCPAGTTAGCLGDAGCKFCKHFDSVVSSHFDFCPGSPASALLVHASADEAQSAQTGLSDGISNLIDSNPVAMYAMAAAACVGVLAVVIAVVVGTRRAVRRFRRATSASEDDEDDESGALSAVNTDVTKVSAEEAAASIAAV